MKEKYLNLTINAIVRGIYLFVFFSFLLVVSILKKQKTKQHTLFGFFFFFFKSLSRVQLSASPWAIVQQAPLYSWDSPGSNTGVGAILFSRGSS